MGIPIQSGQTVVCHLVQVCLKKIIKNVERYQWSLNVQDHYLVFMFFIMYGGQSDTVQRVSRFRERGIIMHLKNTIQYNTIQHTTIKHKTRQYSTIQYCGRLHQYI